MGLWAVLLVLLISGSSRIVDARPDPSSSGDVLRNKNTCSLCEEFTGEALGYLADNKTQNEIMGVLHKSCARALSFKEECIKLVDYYAPLFFMEISSVQPGDFCQKVNLCEKLALLSLQVKEEKCDLCHQVVSQVLEKLKDPDTQMDVIQILLKACNSMEGYAKKCKRIVFEYGPFILANAEQFLETRDVCAAMHACSSSSEAEQQIILETVPGHSSS
ncbi:hypothetical protein MLD38_038374 [Melastoma candidum]|uniref:Uncharacterized protein n=1 Tax=Melastoma candidum TaxID=119954 RepID=A0ACB9KZY4_9MYRT|nr:hypothetical protein MLD38_038374 [Melastoma candidum]